MSGGQSLGHHGYDARHDHQRRNAAPRDEETKMKRNNIEIFEVAQADKKDDYDDNE